MLRIIRSGLAVAVLSLALVFSSGPSASAYVIPPMPVAIGTSIGMPVVETGVVDAIAMGGTCGGALAGPCVILGAAIVGTALYATADSWLPVLDSAVNKFLQPGMGTSITRCGHSWTPGTGIVDNVILAGTSWSKCGAFTDVASTSIKFSVEASTCRVDGKLVSGGFPSKTVYATGPNNGGTMEMPGSLAPCAPGVELVGAILRVSGYGGNGQYKKLGDDVTIPAEQQSTVTTVKCKKPDGSTSSLSSQLLADPTKILIPSCEKAFPGSYPTEIGVKSGLDGQETQEVIPKKVLANPRSLFPDCFDAGGHIVSGCVVKVWINGTPCAVGVSHCEDWENAPREYGDSVNCRFGSYVVDLQNCKGLREAYTSSKPKTFTKVKRDGTPTTDDDPDAKGQPGSPSGQPVDTPWSTTCLNNCAPPSPRPAPPSPKTGVCFAEAISFNPIDWVFVPVKCALSWAFVPESPPDFSEISLTVPPGWIPDMPDLEAGHCGTLSMPSVNLGMVQGGSGAFINTCNAPWPLVRGFVYYGSFALIVVPLGMRLLASVMGTLGAGVKGQIVGGGDDY